ncbi:MAG: M36 family metallopeptidase, partial [Planctomycetales bacterium]|nr:M36 family metallopeptidase [Planctomycetales bacterium]
MSTRFARPISRRRSRRMIGSENRRSPGIAEIACCELLESRLLLSAVTNSLTDIVADADDHAGHDHAVVDFYLPTQYRLNGNGTFLTGPTTGEPFQIASNYLVSHATELGLNSSDLPGYLVSSQYTDEPSGITHIYLRQTHDGLEVMNADLSIHITARGEVINVSSSFIAAPEVAGGLTSQFLIGAPQAFSELSDDLGLGLLATPQIVRVDSESPDLATVLAASGVALDDVEANLVYVPTADGLELAWRLNVQTLDQQNWFDAFVDADSGEPLYVDNFIGYAGYNVFASPLVSPNEGGRTLVVDPQDATASPFGWHDTDGVAGAEFTDTRGNNASVQEDGDANDTGGFRPDGGAGLTFDFPLDTSQDPANFQAATITNVFYWVNRLHDIHYQYGFTEAAGNFQVNNYGHGGVANDAVMVDIQDGSGGLGPSFFTPPDGQSPRLTLFVNSTVSPARDNALDNTVLIHEYGHGISERLTGGPANNSALNATQSRGMGEGWSDWWAVMLTQDASDTKLAAYPVGNWYIGQGLNGGGIRRYPYSFDMSVNPLTMADYNNATTRSSPHKIGEVWASALWDMNWLLIDKYGFSSDFYHGTGGNNLALQLVMDGLKLQGTNPSYLDGRDAILAADVALTGGQNQAEIWTAFARRGMGFSANDGGSASSTSVTEAFDIPGTISGTVFRDDDADGVRDVSEPGLAGWTVYRDLNNNGVQDVATVTAFNSGDTPKAIPNQSNTTSSIVISGLSGVIVDVNLTVNITHPADSELNLALLPPSGTPVILAQFLGGSGDNYTNTVFDDEAATYVTSASAPFTGSFKPYFSLSQLDGVSPNGTWKLRLDDVAAGNSGTLLSWSMQVSYGTPDLTTVSDANGNYTFFSTGNGTHHIREVVQPGFTQTAPAGSVNDVVISDGVPVSGQNLGNRAAASVSNGTTLEDTLSTAIVITPPANLGITHSKISGITGGSLFKNNGVTPINNGDFITVAEGQAGVKFLPSANSNTTGSFTVELSQDGMTALAVASPATSTITVTPVGDTPQVANITTVEDTLSGAIVIGRHAADGAEVTHFKISGLTGGTLFQSDGVTPISNNSFVTFAEGQAGVKFLPSINSTADGHFDAESSQDGSTVAAQSGKATSTITVTPVGDTPQVANITTVEDTLSGAIVIGRHAADGAEVTHFKI